MKTAGTFDSVELREAPYPVWVGENLILNCQHILDFKRYSKVIAVVDKNVFSAHAEILRRAFPSPTSLLEIRVDEAHKSLESVRTLWEEFLKQGLDRKSLVLGIGGGALCDLVGFAAATFMRGCAFAAIPTTLLAQVDASVGGKTGFNHAGIKNLIGIISQPCAVVVDVAFLRSLPLQELRSGVSEMLKHGLIADVAHFEALAAGDPSHGAGVLQHLIAGSLKIKLRIVSQDPAEQGCRKLLNFGHSLGHAIEASALECDVTISHGEAVAIGMAGEAYVSQQRGWLNAQELKTIEDALTHWQLPIRVPQAISREMIISKLMHDKKNVAGSIRMTLLRKLGQGEYDCDISRDALSDCLNYVFRANHSK